MPEESLRTVKDPVTGSNFGGIRQDSLGVGASHRDYINNLLEATRRPVSGPLQSQAQYTPSGGRSPMIGQHNSQTLGSVPIFGSGAAIFPQAILDSFEKAKQDAELSYLNEVGDTSMEDFQLSSTLKNPWLNQAFGAKYQEALDEWLQEYANHFGGDYMKGMKALKGDPEFLRMMKSYSDYANIYNAVFDSAVGILSADPSKTYVDEGSRKMARKFIYDYENLEDLPIDELVRRARKFKTYISAVEVARIAMDGLGQRVVEGYAEATDMGTDATKVYVKQTQKGPSQEELDVIYEAQLKVHPELSNDPVFTSQLKMELQKRADREYEVTIEKIARADADMKTYLKKNGINTNADGRVSSIDEVPTAFRQFAGGKFQYGENAFQYPRKDMSGNAVTVSTPAGSEAYLVSSSGDIHHVVLPTSFGFSPQKEYDLALEKNRYIYNKPEDYPGQIDQYGRYVEGTVFIQDEALYTSPIIKTATQKGEISDVQTIGTEAARPIKQPLSIRDMDTGNSVNLYGNYQIVLPFDGVEDELNLAYPFLQRFHADLEKTKTKPVTEKSTKGGAADIVGDVTSKIAKVFNSKEAAMKAIQSGLVKSGESFTVNGQKYTAK